MELQSNTVLITGGGSGIGLALAQAFVARNSRVIICGRNREKLEAVRDDNPAIDIFRSDIAKEDDQKALVRFVADRYPECNVLINNAGVQYNYNLTDNICHTDVIADEIGCNLLAPLTLTDRLLPLLMGQPNAAIVNITSALALVPKQSAPIYCATKAAMHNFTKVLRYQLQDTSVKVFEIIPALVDTDMTKGRGKGKITPDALASEALRGIKNDKYEIRIEKTKLLFALNRISPSVAEAVIRKG